jgi:hypothetical protein
MKEKSARGLQDNFFDRMEELNIASKGTYGVGCESVAAAAERMWW